MNTKLLLLSVLLAVFAASAGERSESSKEDGGRWFVGLGAGHTSGNGLQVGMIRGPHTGQLGLGLLYDGERARFRYSLGGRYLRELYTGEVNDTYAWGGAALHGNHVKDRENAHTVTAGAGLGIAFHFGLPFRFFMDSGFALSRERQEKHIGITGVTVDRRFGPVINGGVLYAW